MAKHGGGLQLRIDLSGDEARELLDRLATDRDFHARFREDPRAVLEEMNVQLSGETLLPSGDDVPDMKTIQEFRESGFFKWPPFGRPYLGCLIGSVLYGIASRAEPAGGPEQEAEAEG